MTTNPDISKYFRVPKQYVFLPTDGKLYDSTSVKLTSTNQLPVRAMTAKDELLLKNPDALLNGDAIIKVVKSCVPEVEDPSKLFAPDMEVILMAIFAASYDRSLETKLTCEKCKKETQYQVPVEQLIRQVYPIENIPQTITHTIKTQESLIEYHIDVIPYTYNTVTLAGMADLSHAQMVKTLVSSDVSDEEKLTIYNKAFTDMTLYQMKSVFDTVTKITIHDSSIDHPIECSDKEQIEEFLSNTETALIEKIIAAVKELNSSGIDTTFTVKCPNNKCNHEWKTEMDFDPARFFGQRSGQGMS